jgi:hypothetical protein
MHGHLVCINVVHTGTALVAESAYMTSPWLGEQDSVLSKNGIVFLFAT